MGLSGLGACVAKAVDFKNGAWLFMRLCVVAVQSYDAIPLGGTCERCQTLQND